MLSFSGLNRIDTSEWLSLFKEEAANRLACSGLSSFIVR